MKAIIQYRLWQAIQIHRQRAQALDGQGRRNEAVHSFRHAGRCLRVLLDASTGAR